MWTEFLNESRSQRKYPNRPVLVLGSRHSGKRTVLQSLFQISKTTRPNKKLASQPDANKMRLKGVASAIDYAYLNVIDILDPDNRTHTKLDIYIVEEIDNMAVNVELTKPEFIKQCVIIIMLDFTNPWLFKSELEKWTKFINELQQMAKLTISELNEMAAKQEQYYSCFNEPQFDESGKLKIHTAFASKEEQMMIPIPEDVLRNNLRVPLIICANKSDLQSQVLRDQSANKLIIILYHLRTFCAQYGATLIYTSQRNNINLSVLYEYMLHRAYGFPLRFKTETINEEAMFIPFGYDNFTLIKDSVVKIDVQKPYGEAIPAPLIKKVAREEISVEEDSQYFKKYINTAQSAVAAITTSQVEEKLPEKKKTEVENFFKELLSGGNPRVSAMAGSSQQTHNQKLLNAEKELMRHTSQVILDSNKRDQLKNLGLTATQEKKIEE